IRGFCELTFTHHGLGSGRIFPTGSSQRGAAVWNEGAISMKIGRFAANASLLSLSLALLAACGGGSGGGPVSTPGPAPAPAPTPGQTPTPTGGVNDDLLTPLVSETFSTFAVRGSASYPTNGNPGSSSAGSATLSITYNASANTYQVSSGGTQQTFGSGDIEQSLSNSQGTTYVSQTGSTTK